MREDLSLNAFTDIDHVERLATYVEALEAFDGIEQLQELKQIARSRVRPGTSVLDVGCGFGLETLQLARLVRPAKPCGIDKSEHFIEEARRRAAAARLTIDYAAGSADALPYVDGTFDHVRSERLLIYFDDVKPALAEMKRVLRSDGMLALIEPEFGTTTINLADRGLVRRVIAYEADSAVAQSWLPGRLPEMLRELGFGKVELFTRVVVMPQPLAAGYFTNVGRKAARAGAISDAELAAWISQIEALQRSGSLLGSEGFFLFIATM